MPPVMRLYEDSISGGAAAVSLPALARMIFVVHGAVTIDGKALRDGEAWSGEGACSLAPGKDGVTLWRFELAASGSTSHPIKGALRSQEKLAAVLETIPQGELLLRGDSVAFPPGGCAYLHRHQGPGIRCLIEGSLRIDSAGRSHTHEIGDAWFESGPDPVFAQAGNRPTRFIRVMILPSALIGKSSIQYVNDEDKAKPRTQQYRVYVDAPLARSS